MRWEKRERKWERTEDDAAANFLYVNARPPVITSPTLCRPTAIYNYTNNLKAKAAFGRISFSMPLVVDAFLPSNPLILLEGLGGLSRNEIHIFLRIPGDKKNSKKRGKLEGAKPMLFYRTLATVMQRFRAISSLLALLNGRN